MDPLSFATIDLLAQTVPGPCISIFVPLQRGKFDEVAACLELKNLVALVSTSIEDQMRRPEVDELLVPAEDFDCFSWFSIEYLCQRLDPQGYGLSLPELNARSVRFERQASIKTFFERC